MDGRFFFVVAVLSAGAIGCSGQSSSEGGDGDSGESSGGSMTGGAGGNGGTSGNGGGNGASGGRAAKLGLYVFVRNPDPGSAAGMQCPASSGIEWDIGMPVVSNGIVVDVDSPTPTDFGTTLEDGENDTEIACSVTAEGTFTIEGGGIDPMITVPNGLVNIALDGTARLPELGTLTAFSLYTPITFQLSNSGGPACAITTVHEVAPGALWADFDCPALLEPTSPDLACHASGTIVVEYCSTQ